MTTHHPPYTEHVTLPWTAKNQSAASLAERHRRNRRNRNVRLWNGDDGTVQMRGAFDAEMGARIRAEAERLRRADRRLQRDNAGSHSAGHNSAVRDGTARHDVAGEAAARTRDQRMADAFDGLLARATHTSFCDPARGDGTSGRAPADSPGSNGMPTDDFACDHTAADNPTCHDDTAAGCGHAACDGTGSAGRTTPSVQMIVRADLADLLDRHGETGGTGEIAGIGPVPASVLDRLACNADISVILFGKQLTPLYEAVASRAPTAAQRRALIARDGACIGCGAAPGDCEAHHIIPWKCDGPTKIDNLVLVCWSCHDRIHDHNWQVVRRNSRYRLIPPDAASAPNRARSRKPAPRRPPQPIPPAALPGKLTPRREPALFP